MNAICFVWVAARTSLPPRATWANSVALTSCWPVVSLCWTRLLPWLARSTWLMTSPTHARQPDISSWRTYSRDGRNSLATYKRRSAVERTATHRQGWRHRSSRRPSLSRPISHRSRRSNARFGRHFMVFQHRTPQRLPRPPREPQRWIWTTKEQQQLRPPLRALPQRTLPRLPPPLHRTACSPVVPCRRTCLWP